MTCLAATSDPSSAEFAELVRRYPLPHDASAIELFVDTVRVCGVPLRLAGVAAEYDGECVTGSAAELVQIPLRRAYMELVERLSVLVALRDGSFRKAVDRAGRTQGTLQASVIFPDVPADSPWRWARSNGIAAGRTFQDAAGRARGELIERDRVLRSWFGEIKPEPLPIPCGSIPGPLASEYDFHACAFGAPWEGMTVTGVFAFPTGGGPYAQGLAAGRTLQASIEGAARECLQCMGFLWGEALPLVSPSPCATPSFHQDHYLFAGNHGRLRCWLRGEHLAFKDVLRSTGPILEPLYVDLTLPWLVGKLSVVKAVPRGQVPLTFGPDHPYLRRPAPDGLAVHPIP